MNINTKRRILRRRKKKNNNGLLLRLLIGAIAIVFFAATLVAISGIGTAVGVYAYYAKDLPDPGRIETEQQEFETTKIYDRTGQVLLYEIFDPRFGDRSRTRSRRNCRRPPDARSRPLRWRRPHRPRR